MTASWTSTLSDDMIDALMRPPSVGGGASDPCSVPLCTLSLPSVDAVLSTSPVVDLLCFLRFSSATSIASGAALNLPDLMRDWHCM